jgi:hypothetical protein
MILSVPYRGARGFSMRMSDSIIIQNIIGVDHSLLSVDADRTVCKTLQILHKKYGNIYNLAFANGGDQNNDIFRNALYVNN